jgi:cellulose synthase/poly-beta-1,6-N-acetylglucosamine synthase-like glycosyltransferase
LSNLTNLQELFINNQRVPEVRYTAESFIGLRNLRFLNSSNNNMNQGVINQILLDLNQNYDKFKILFTDDCSSDNTFDVVQRVVSSHKNKDKALTVLRSRLYEKELAIKQAEDATKRSSQVSSGDRSAKIRTYNYSQGRVTDHRIGLDVFDMDGVMNGKIQKFVDELQLVNNMEKLKENEVF